MPINIRLHTEFMIPVLDALEELGGSGTNEEILNRVVELCKLSEEQVSALHLDGPRTVVDYSIAWAKSYLKRTGFLENPSRSVWALTRKGSDPSCRVTPREIVTQYHNLGQENNVNTVDTDEDVHDVERLGFDDEGWIETLISNILKISPSGFEKLCQLVLRRNGFSKVEVTGRSHDGGIDGIGILKISLVTFTVLFQCKRYKGSVGADKIRDFRGAMSGRTDKGIMFTTGSFTREAVKEASRDGAETIELVGGKEFCYLLKDLEMGVKTKELIIVDEAFFEEYR